MLGRKVRRLSLNDIMCDSNETTASVGLLKNIR